MATPDVFNVRYAVPLYDICICDDDTVTT